MSADVQPRTQIRPQASPHPHRYGHGNVRRRGRDRWQARVYGGSRRHCWVSVGVYETEVAAWQVVRKVLAAVRASGGPPSPLAVWRAARRLAANGWDVGGQLGALLPKWVCPDGLGGYGYRLRGGNGCDRGGYQSAGDAYGAAVAARKRERKRFAVGKTVQLSLLGLIGLEEEGDADRAAPARREGRRRVHRGVNPAQLTFDVPADRHPVAQATRSDAETPLGRSA